MENENLMVLDWNQLHQDAIALSAHLAPLGPFKGVVAIARGGLVPAAIVAHQLGLRLIDTISVSTYNGQEKGESEILSAIKGDGEGWLVVDDLVDTGATFRLLRLSLPKARFAAIYAKPAGKDAADLIEIDVSQNRWVVFPWEND